MAQKIDGRVAYADLLRVFATIAVIVLHLAGSQMGQVAVTSQAWFTPPCPGICHPAPGFS